jgi:hypothetical protein
MYVPPSSPSVCFISPLCCNSMFSSHFFNSLNSRRGLQESLWEEKVINSQRSSSFIQPLPINEVGPTINIPDSDHYLVEAMAAKYSPNERDPSQEHDLSKLVSFPRIRARTLVSFKANLKNQIVLKSKKHISKAKATDTEINRAWIRRETRLVGQVRSKPSVDSEHRVPSRPEPRFYF